MNAYTFQIADQDIYLAVDKVKYLLGDNHKLKYDIKKTLRQAFSKTDNSDFAIEHGLSRRCLINEKELNTKNYIYFNVNHSYDFLEDMKLKTSSMFYHYLSKVVENIEYSDTFNTLSILFTDLAEELNEKIDDSDNHAINLSMKPLNAKSILKWIDLELINDGNAVNPFDLSYEEYIIFQLKTIEKLSKLTPGKTHIVFLEIAEITKPLESFLNSITIENINILVDTSKYCPQYIDNVAWLSNTLSVDFSDEIQVYEKITMHHEHHCTVEDSKKAYETHINNQTLHHKGII